MTSSTSSTVHLCATTHSQQTYDQQNLRNLSSDVKPETVRQIV